MTISRTISRRAILSGAAAVVADTVVGPLRAAAAEAKRVRITGIESFGIRLPGPRDPYKVYDYGVSRVHTDAGVTGTAFLRCHDIYGPARLAAEVDILITGGELAKSTYEFLEFLVNRTYDIVQPDTRICGGILMARKISILAETFGVPCIQHGTASLSLAGYIQAGCSMPNCEWQEIIGNANLPQEQWEPAKKLVRTPDVFHIENGYIHLPDLPGLGLDLNEDAIKEYRV